MKTNCHLLRLQYAQVLDPTLRRIIEPSRIFELDSQGLKLIIHIQKNCTYIGVTYKSIGLKFQANYSPNIQHILIPTRLLSFQLDSKTLIFNLYHLKK